MANENNAVMAAPKKKHEGSLKARRIAGNTAVYIVLVLISIIWLVPFVCILFQSFNIDWKIQALANGVAAADLVVVALVKSSLITGDLITTSTYSRDPIS